MQGTSLGEVGVDHRRLETKLRSEPDAAELQGPSPDRLGRYADVIGGLVHREPRFSYTSPSTVSAVEDGKRSVSVQELVVLGLLLGANPPQMLSELSVGLTGDVYAAGQRLDGELFELWLRGRGNLQLNEQDQWVMDEALASEFYAKSPERADEPLPSQTAGD